MSRYAYAVPVDEIPKLSAIADYFGKDLVRVKLLADGDHHYDCDVWIGLQVNTVRVRVSGHWVTVIPNP